nr:MAG TPA: hypothetical protein [Myoviridae sp. ct3tv2]
MFLNSFGMNNVNFFQINLKKLLTLNKSSIIYIYG